MCKKNLTSNALYCPACVHKLPYLDSTCVRCGQPFSGFDDYCGACLTNPPSFDACFCPFEYLAPISDDICRLKYAEQPQLAQRLAKQFVQELTHREVPLPNAIISVPMHRFNLRKRGFNQSHELAKQISSQLKIPLARNVIAKNKLTERQATQTLQQRKNNLKGSFSIAKKPRFKHIAIVDDVVTTGATAEEISKILKKNGVDYVQIWGIARTR